MEFTEEQIAKIVKYASISYDPEKICKILGFNEEEFVIDFHNDDSQLSYHYDRGQLIAKVEIDLKNLQNAKEGDLFAQQVLKNDTRDRKLANYKKKQNLDTEKKNYNQLQAMVEKGDVQNLPER